LQMTKGGQNGQYSVPGWFDPGRFHRAVSAIGHPLYS